MGKGIAIVGIWIAVAICSIYAPKMVEQVSMGAVLATFIVAIVSFN